MKFYYHRSACSLAVRIILNELNREYDAIEVDLKSKTTSDGVDFLMINPKGSVPAIQLDSGEVLTENQVILQYLADTSKNQQLLAPVEDLTRYHTLEWLNFVATEMHKSIGALFKPELNLETKNNLFLPLIDSKLNFLNDHFKQNTYLMGASFTLPDAYLFVILRWTYHLNIDLTPFPSIVKFMQHIQERSSVVDALQQENL